MKIAIEIFILQYKYTNDIEDGLLFTVSDKRKSSLTHYSLCLLLVLLFLGVDCQFEMELDSYVSFLNNDIWKWMLHGNGRVIDAAIYYVFENLSIPAQVTYTISYATAVLFLSLSVFIYSGVIARILNSKPQWSIFLSFVCIVNPHIIGYFRFIEKGLMNGAIFFSVCGCFFFERYLREKRNKDFFFSLVCLFIVAFIYQITLGIFVLLCIPVVIRYTHSFLSFWGYGITVLTEYGIASALSFSYTVIFEKTERVGDAGSMSKEAIQRFFYVFEKLPNTLEAAYRYFRPNLYPSFLIVCVLLLFGTLLLVRFEDKRYYVTYFCLDCIIVYFSIAISLVPWMLGMVECEAPRTAYPCFSIAGILLISALVICEKHELRNIPGIIENVGQLLFGVFMLAYLIVQWSCTIKFFEDRYARNAIDCYESQYIQDRIDEYESTSGKTITKVAIYFDRSVSCNYFTMWSGSSVNPYTIDFTDVEVLNYFSGREYTRGVKNAEYEEYFSSKNWDSFREELFIFSDDTIHLCIF